MSDFDFRQLGNDLLAGVSDAAESVADAARSVGSDASRYKSFLQAGRYLDAHDLVSTHGGNLSTCDGQNLWISRTNALLGFLMPSDIVACSLTAPGAAGVAVAPGAAGAEATSAPTAAAPTAAATSATAPPGSEADARASRELPVHRAIYQAAFSSSGEGRPLAIVHAHPLTAIALSLAAEQIQPLDSEGLYLLGEAVPVIAPKETIASDEAAEMLASLMAKGIRCALIRGHGSFALASDLLAALQLTVALERSAKMRVLLSAAYG
ncbi:MAG: class II aldolase/adducin family protein [Coriobacteriales bacterium]|jgi:L-fuculose-phosphate aldolase|nr:class II aldolase/adducin family protein [Coriobacteriales bacterium]